MRRVENIHFNESPEIIRVAHEQAKTLITQNEIKPENFTDLYSPDVISRDLAYVESMERKFDRGDNDREKQSKMFADILEAIIFEHGEQSNWFGEQATTIKTSRYDDIYNGVDMITEFDEGQNRSSHAAFAIDATYSHDKAGEKFGRIKKKIDSGKLAKVRYFISGSFRGELSDIPMTVASAHPRTVTELTELWINNDKQKLANHWIQFQLLEELMAQCQAFSVYAQKKGSDFMAERYKHIEEITREILRQKRGLVKDTGQRDDNFQQTLSDLDWWLKE